MNSKFISENLMGPNAVSLLKELLNEVTIKPKMRILDLGCGMGLTSIYLASNYDVEVFAVDLWISATDNYQRFKQFNLEDKIIPIHCDANKLGFAEDYFDMIISIDSYHYYGDNNQYLSKLLPLLKPKGKLLLAIPGVINSENNFYDKFKEYIPNEDDYNIYSMDWWQKNFDESKQNIDFNLILAKEMDCYYDSWIEWINSDNKFGHDDRKMFSETKDIMNMQGYIIEKP